MPVIRIDDEVMQLLKDHAEPLKDSPNSTLRQVLGLDEYVDRTWSYQARLSRLGQALISNDKKSIAKELHDIEMSARTGSF